MHGHLNVKKRNGILPLIAFYFSVWGESKNADKRTTVTSNVLNTSREDTHKTMMYYKCV